MRKKTLQSEKNTPNDIEFLGKIRFISSLGILELDWNSVRDFFECVSLKKKKINIQKCIGNEGIIKTEHLSRLLSVFNQQDCPKERTEERIILEVGSCFVQQTFLAEQSSCDFSIEEKVRFFVNEREEKLKRKKSKEKSHKLMKKKSFAKSRNKALKKKLFLDECKVFCVVRQTHCCE